MSERKELLPGSFCWPELATTDIAKAKAFFSSLFGWEPSDVPSAGGTYTIFKLRGLDVAACRSFGPEESLQKIPAHFTSYVSAASVDASAEKAKALGGKVLHGPFDVMGIGRMAVVSDPEGLAFAIWEARAKFMCAWRVRRLWRRAFTASTCRRSASCLLPSSCKGTN